MSKIRANDLSMIWYGGRLSQQYVVDNYVKIETHKLRWFEHNQDSIRADLYQGLQDAFHEGECDTGNVNFTLEIYITSLMANLHQYLLMAQLCHLIFRKCWT